jgi:hypothetical protein
MSGVMPSPSGFIAHECESRRSVGNSPLDVGVSNRGGFCGSTRPAHHHRDLSPGRRVVAGSAWDHQQSLGAITQPDVGHRVREDPFDRLREACRAHLARESASRPTVPDVDATDRGRTHSGQRARLTLRTGQARVTSAESRTEGSQVGDGCVVFDCGAADGDRERQMRSRR